MLTPVWIKAALSLSSIWLHWAVAVTLRKRRRLGALWALPPWPSDLQRTACSSASRPYLVAADSAETAGPAKTAASSAKPDFFLRNLPR